jgi:2,5-furandicarboxylate decarboxylase 1
MTRAAVQPEKESAAAAAERRGDNSPQPVRSLREWLDHLARRDRLLVLDAGVALRFELAAIAKRLDGRRATLFPRPGGHRIPVISGLVSDRNWMAEAMAVEPGELLARFQEAALHPLAWRETVSAPAQEVIHREVDLARLLPLPVHNEHDSAPYVTAGLMITRNPRTGQQNVSIHRCQLSGPNRLGVLLLPRHAHMFFEMAEAGGRPLEAAIAVGVDPLTLLASQAIAPLDVDELEVAGALHRRPSRAKQPCSPICGGHFPMCATCTCPGAACAATTSTSRSTSARRAKPRTSCWEPLPVTLT